MTKAGPEWRARGAHAAVQLVGTVGAFLLLTGGSYAWLPHSAAGGLVLAVAAGLALVRVFILQHDCAHRALFPRPRTNDRVGAVLGVLTLAPHGYWRAMHLVHHATSGDLERRGTGDIRTLTAREYRALAPARRLQYRLFRHPLVLLGLGPVFQFLFRFRLPSQVPPDRRAERRSIWWTNLGVLTIHGAFAASGDWPRWLLIQLVITQVSAGVGIWLFYVQHQVEAPYWARRPTWSMRDSALAGSSHLVLPRPLEWLFAAINLHHVHHLDPQIPNDLLRRYMHHHGLSEAGVRLGFWESLRTFELKVYDEDAERMTGFPLIASGSAATGRLALSGEEH